MLKTNPTVFAVNNVYQIIVPVENESFFWVRVGDKNFYDASNGIMRSATNIHKADIPQEALNEAGEYTVFLRPVLERKTYGVVTGDAISFTFPFKAPPAGNIRIYNISDAHGLVAEPIAAAKAFGKIDLLVLCGDIINDCNTNDCFMNIYKICSGITGGSIPVVSARGNHDMRGKYAEKFSECMPSANGKIYYTFNIGSLWGVVLDCGEITADSDPAHGFTVCCDPFRREQIEFLKGIVANKENEYAAKNIKNRIVVVHDPFFEKHIAPYDVARDIFKEWFEQINENINPDFWLCGHSHLTEVRFPGYAADEFGIKSPLVMASTPGNNFFVGGGIDLKDNGIFITFTDSNGKHFESIKI